MDPTKFFAAGIGRIPPAKDLHSKPLQRTPIGEEGASVLLA
jgi:hypothetical protein